MKAAIYRSYGPPEVLKIEEVDPPTTQDDFDDRVLIKVHCSSVNPFDYLHRKGYLPVRLTNGFTNPKQRILGIDVAGIVEAVGKNVSRFKVGDAVFGSSYGSHAEYVRVREAAISLLPEKTTFREAAAVPTAGLTALQALRDVAQIRRGQKALVYGASGGVGHMAVQIAKFFEAEVTAVCSAANADWVKALGADHVIDYAAEDFTANGQRYDIILDAVARRTFFNCRRSLTENGVYVTENPLQPASQLPQLLLSSLMGDKRAKTHMAKPNHKDLDFFRELIAGGQLKPVIEKTYPLAQIVEAHRHVESGHTKGKVVVEIQKE